MLSGMATFVYIIFMAHMDGHMASHPYQPKPQCKPT